MSTAALIAALVALVLALLAYSRAGHAASRIDDAASEARRVARSSAEELKASLETLRQLLAKVASGEPVERDMILEGRLWRDVGDAEGQRLLAECSADLAVVDVRTPQETAAGVLPGALLIPVDELEERKSEIPAKGKTVLVYCAGGGRSAAACEFLSSQGYEGLVNLEGGFTSWTGPRERPGA